LKLGRPISALTTRAPYMNKTMTDRVLADIVLTGTNPELGRAMAAKSSDSYLLVSRSKTLLSQEKIQFRSEIQGRWKRRTKKAEGFIPR